MKKLSDRAKRRLIWKSLKGQSRSHARRVSTNQRILSLRTRYPNINVRYARGQIQLTSPAIMRLSKATNDEVLQFLACIRQTVGFSARSFRVDFTSIEELSPLCAMLLASEIQRWKLVKNCKLRIVDSEKWNPRIKALLDDMGVFDLVAVDNPRDNETISTDEKFIRIRSGQLVKMDHALENIQEEVSRVACLIESQPQLYGGIEEAITNVLHWAYKGAKDGENPKVIDKRWWFTASYNESTRRFTLMVYDHGIGIPKTLPTAGHLIEPFRKWLSNTGLSNSWNDAHVIQAALELPRSKSELGYRGKGLQEMKRLLSNFNRGTLMILSQRGECRVHSDGSTTTTLHDYPLGGTLIVWEVYTD